MDPGDPGVPPHPLNRMITGTAIAARDLHGPGSCLHRRPAVPPAIVPAMADRCKEAEPTEAR
jgi:hypothetical protein